MRPPAVRAFLVALGLPAAAVAEGPFQVSPLDPRLEARPALRERLLGSAHGYLRFFSTPFAQRVCERFSEVQADLPVVNLHGDAHLEQYAVTSLGRGLTDFDDATRGPFVLDLVRFGVSLDLAARERGWPGEAKKSLDALLKGYRTGLGKAKSPVPTPRVVTRIRGTFRLDHAELLRRADAFIDASPLPLEALSEHFRGYVAQRLRERSGMPEGFFRLKKAGMLRLGIGSALDEKYLVRIEGWTDVDGDDVVLEAKLVRDVSGIECAQRGIGPTRVLTANALIAYEPYPFAGLLVREGRTLWVHGWPDDYEELSIARSFRTPEELREVAFDVGVQLGRAHPKPMTGPTQAAMRRGVRAAARRHEARVRAAVEELGREVEAAWLDFRRAAGR